MKRIRETTLLDALNLKEGYYTVYNKKLRGTESRCSSQQGSILKLNLS